MKFSLYGFENRTKKIGKKDQTKLNDTEWKKASLSDCKDVAVSIINIARFF